MELVSLVILTL